jgi:hypothetical protein
LNGSRHVYKNKTVGKHGASFGSGGLDGFSTAAFVSCVDSGLVDLGESIECYHPLALCSSLGLFYLPFARYFPHFFDFLLVWLLKKFIPWLSLKIKVYSFDVHVELARRICDSCLCPDCFLNHLVYHVFIEFKTELFLDLNQHLKTKTVGSDLLGCSFYSLSRLVACDSEGNLLFVVGSKTHCVFLARSLYLILLKAARWLVLKFSFRVLRWIFCRITISFPTVGDRFDQVLLGVFCFQYFTWQLGQAFVMNNKMLLYKFAKLHNEALWVTTDLVTEPQAYSLHKFVYLDHVDLCE